MKKRISVPFLAAVVVVLIAVIVIVKPFPQRHRRYSRKNCWSSPAPWRGNLWTVRKGAILRTPRRKPC